MTELRDVIPEIVDKLKSLNPYKVILFGSLSKNETATGNDIDIAVILNSEILPSSFEERMENAIIVEEALFDLSLKFPIDITVYTKSEFSVLNEQQQTFAKELNSGKIIYDIAS
jgi:predicted nucleotidyltransferase